MDFIAIVAVSWGMLYVIIALCLLLTRGSKTCPRTPCWGYADGVERERSVSLHQS